MEKCRKVRQQPRKPPKQSVVDGLLCEGTLRNWSAANRIPFVRIGGKVFVSTHTLDELVAGRLVVRRGERTA